MSTEELAEQNAIEAEEAALAAYEDPQDYHDGYQVDENGEYVREELSAQAKAMTLADLTSPQGIADLPEDDENEANIFRGGGDTYTEHREGISDTVTTIPFIDKRYPHFEVTSFDGMATSSIQILASSLKAGKLLPGSGYPVYYRGEQGLLELGECHQEQVKMLVRLVGESNLLVRPSEGQEITGRLIYAFSK